MGRVSFIKMAGVAVVAMGSAFAASRFVAPPRKHEPKEPSLDHLPRTIEELLALSSQQKILLSAATASGCDAVAYYMPDASGKLTLKEHIDLYPTANTLFDKNITYNPETFSTDKNIRNSPVYHIPVPGTNGVIALHAPQRFLSRVQSEEEALDPSDAHEPVRFRRAKLEMATDIVNEHSDLFSVPKDNWRERTRREKEHKTLPKKLAYFHRLVDDMHKTLGEDGFQVAHVHGVSDLMLTAIDEAVNKNQVVPVINQQQRELIAVLTELHDVGKTQLSSSLLRAWRSSAKQKSKDKKSEEHRYDVSINHNHPLFTLTTLLLYEQDGLTTAAHHHGLFRYTSEELAHAIGEEGFKQYHILTDNIPFDKLPPLSRMMRICDVTESMVGRYHKDMDHCLRSMAKQAGYDADNHCFRPVVHNANTIDPEMLCFMISSGVFEAYAKKHPEVSCDAQKVEGASREILEAFGWKDKQAGLEEKLRSNIASDRLLLENPGLSRTPAAIAQR